MKVAKRVIEPGIAAISVWTSFGRAEIESLSLSRFMKIHRQVVPRKE
jgi:hypothetical protein